MIWLAIICMWLIGILMVLCDEKDRTDGKGGK
jgi:hypothetical protein